MSAALALAAAGSSSLLRRKTARCHPRRSIARQKTRVTLYLVTHAECHIPIELVTALRRLAVLHAVFVRPSSSLHLDYLPLLQRYHVISDEALRTESVRKKQALAILQQVDPR